MGSSGPIPLRIAVVGGGPAGSFFALYTLKYAREAGRDVAITIYEGKNFGRFGQPGCNMCAGLLPVSVLSRFPELDLTIPPELILGHISTYSLHTSAGTLDATQPDPHADVVAVYRGAGPRYGHPPDLLSFDEFLIEQAASKGATLRRSFVEAIRCGRPVEVESAGECQRYDLVVLAIGVNGCLPALHRCEYRPPPLGSMCQTELYLGRDEVERRLGSAVHIFLPPDEIATYGIVIPKGPFVTVSLLGPRQQMRSLRQFLALAEVRSGLGDTVHQVCGCQPRISVGLARNVVGDGFVAIGDASATRLYKNGIGSALTTAERAAWTVVYRGCAREDFRASYLPLCRTIDFDNQIGRLLFLQVPVLKHLGALPRAHHRLAAPDRRHPGVSELHARILWGMFTGAYSYRSLLRMSMSPGLVAELALALGRTVLKSSAR